MKFFAHSELQGRHSFLSASKYAWIRYDEANLLKSFETAMDAAMGTRLHEFAAEAIRLKRRMPDSGLTLDTYVNDAIGYRMTPEVMLFASNNGYGTADAISFHDNVLRIHDLKNGVTPAKFDQLLIYACYFLIEYKFKANEIKIILRIYQNDEVLEMVPDITMLAPIIDKFHTFDDLLNQWKAQLSS